MDVCIEKRYINIIHYSLAPHDTYRYLFYHFLIIPFSSCLIKSR
jgi:hypothetical protein